MKIKSAMAKFFISRSVIRLEGALEQTTYRPMELPKTDNVKIKMYTAVKPIFASIVNGLGLGGWFDKAVSELERFVAMFVQFIAAKRPKRIHKSMSLICYFLFRELHMA